MSFGACAGGGVWFLFQSVFFFFLERIGRERLSRRVTVQRTRKSPKGIMSARLYLLELDYGQVGTSTLHERLIYFI